MTVLTIISNEEGVCSVLHNTPSNRDGTLDILETTHGTYIMCLTASKDVHIHVHEQSSPKPTVLLQSSGYLRIHEHGI